jgi:hypothetical protein
VPPSAVAEPKQGLGFIWARSAMPSSCLMGSAHNYPDPWAILPRRPAGILRTNAAGFAVFRVPTSVGFFFQQKSPTKVDVLNTASN